MRIWLLSIGEPLPCDSAGDRLWRTGLLAEALVNKGHEVTWWTSTFHHKEKQHRSMGDITWAMHPRCDIHMLHARGYRKNVSLGRYINHRILAKKFRQQSGQEPRPDIILCSLPTLDFCSAATEFGKKHNIPVVLDIRDLWPDTFIDLVPRSVRSSFRRVLSPLFRTTQMTCASATAITGVTEEFVDWGLQKSGRQRRSSDRAFPMGYDRREPSFTQILQAKEFWRSHGISQENNEFILCFFGTLSRHFEHRTVLEAADLLSRTEKPIRIVVCGAGPNSDKWLHGAEKIQNVTLPGWVNAAQIWVLMRMSAAGLAPYVSTHDFSNSLPNKSIEYLSAGLPVISSLKGVLAELLLKHNCGITYSNKQSEQLAKTILKLFNNPRSCSIMATNADALYQKRFVADDVYSEMADHLARLVEPKSLLTRSA